MKNAVSALIDSLLQKLWAVCKAGVQSLAQDPEHEVQEGSFLHSVAVWVKQQILTTSLDIERYQNLRGEIRCASKVDL